MKDTSIARVECWACTVPLPSPLPFGAFTVTARSYAVLRITTRGGLVGCAVGHTRRSPVDVAIADLLAPLLVGQDAAHIEGRMGALRRAVLAMEDDGVIGRALSLVDIALWDIKAQSFGVPLWAALGGEPRPLPVALVEGYELAGETTIDIAERIVARAGEGYRLIKMEAAHYGRPEPVARILSAALARAPDLEFSCDLAWSCATAAEVLRAARAWDGLGVAWIEDAMVRTRVNELAFVRQHAGVPIGIGDETTRPGDLEALMAANALDVVRVDATTIGGIGPALRLAGQARARGLRVSFHVNPELHRHAIVAGGGADHIEIFPADRPFDCSHLLIDRPAFDDVRDGVLPVPDAPGIGVRLNDEAVECYAVRRAVLEA